MTLVIDSSVVFAALVDRGPLGEWAEQTIASDDIAAPHLMPVEVANILRRAAQTGDLSGETATLAYDDLLALRVALFDYAPFAPRIWELRHNLPAYDAWYVALAEGTGARLATLDARLAGSTGPTCTFTTPP